MFGRRSLLPLEERLNYRFTRPELLKLALTHRSAANEHGVERHYERLEFLGDAVLGLVAASWLYDRNPTLPEGQLSKLKAQLVSRATLAPHAERLALGPELELGIGEERSGGRTKASLLANSLEAVFGAIYMDGGLDAARAAIVTMLETASTTGAPLLSVDAKTRLQEVSQANGGELPEYRMVGQKGPDHDKVYEVEVWVSGAFAGRGEGSSKKAAEQKAAADALERMGK